MKNENLKANEVVETVEVAQVNEEAVETVESVTLPIYVERTAVHSNGKKLYNYVVKGKMLNREIKADLIASDVGGYEILDIAFGAESKMLLGIERSVRTDALGKAVRYNSYYVEGTDEIGITFKVGIKPRETSDKTYLEYIIAKEQKLLESKEK